MQSTPTNDLTERLLGALEAAGKDPAALVPEDLHAFDQFYEIFAGPEPMAHFPVPWARERGISFLVAPETMRAHLRQAGLEEISWADATEESVAWFRQTLAQGPPPVSLASLMGPEFPTMARNVLRNLEEDRLRVALAVFAAS